MERAGLILFSSQWPFPASYHFLACFLPCISGTYPIRYKTPEINSERFKLTITLRNVLIHGPKIVPCLPVGEQPFGPGYQRCSWIKTLLAPRVATLRCCYFYFSQLVFLFLLGEPVPASVPGTRTSLLRRNSTTRGSGPSSSWRSFCSRTRTARSILATSTWRSLLKVSLDRLWGSLRFTLSALASDLKMN